MDDTATEEASGTSDSGRHEMVCRSVEFYKHNTKLDENLFKKKQTKCLYFFINLNKNRSYHQYHYLTYQIAMELQQKQATIS